MVSSAPSPQYLLSVLLLYAEDETGIGPGVVDTPFKIKSSNSVKDVR